MNNDIQQLTSQQLVKGKILKLINNSSLQPGDKIQSQNKFAKLLKVGPMTVHYALRELVDEGILFRTKGKGTFINELPDKRNQLKLALILARPNLTDPDENPDHWHGLQQLIKHLHSNLDENTVLSSIICDPEENFDFVKSKLRDFDVAVFSGDHEFRRIIDFISNNPFIQTLVTAASGMRSNCLTISTDSAQNIKTGIHYLINSGHHNIAYVGTDGIQKLNGYKKAISDYGMVYDEEIVVMGINKIADGRKGASILLNRKKEFDAVFVDSDLKAIEFLRHLRQSGINVPNDVSVMGYGSPTIMGVEEKMTMVKSPVREMISEVMEFLKEWGKSDRKIFTKTMNFNGEVAVGETCIRRMNITSTNAGN